MSTINRKRGDNYPIQAIITLNGEMVDLTGSIMKFSFKSSDGTGEVTTIEGVNSVEDTGWVQFTPTIEQMGTAGQYIYDIQRDASGVISTHLSGLMLLEGDVTV